MALRTHRRYRLFREPRDRSPCCAGSARTEHHGDRAYLTGSWAAIMDLRALQRPLKERYRADPTTSRITLQAKGTQTDAPISCSVDLGRAIYDAQAHAGVGGAGTGACSGDLLLGALAACAQITCQMVATAMGVPTRRIEVIVEG